MKDKDRVNVIKFYKKRVWMPGMPESDTLTEEQLKDLNNTLWFARWMLAGAYDEAIIAIKDTINKLKHEKNQEK